MPVQLLFSLALVVSLALWIQPASGWRQRLRTAPEGREDARPAWAFWAAVGWVMLILVNRIGIDFSGKLPEPSSRQVWISLYLACGILAITATLLFADVSHPGMLSRCGADGNALRSSVPLGLEIFFAAILPTVLALLLTRPFRSAETQHTMLQLLREHPDPGTLAVLMLTVVVLAPLAEELVFRATLQGELTHRLGFRWSWPITAITFSAVHGWRDGLALLPLAAILGLAYHQSRNYYAVAIAHGLFNAANLAVALTASNE